MINGKRYVGKTVRRLEDRRILHERDAKGGSKLAFHRAIRKYGKEAFEWSVLMHDDDENDLNISEALAIRVLKTRVPSGYNMTSGGEGGDCFLGRKHTEESKEKIRLARRRRKNNTKEQNEKIRRALIGHVMSAKAKEKFTFAGRKHSDESKKKLSLSRLRLGIKLSEENKKKFTFAGRRHSEETKEKMRRSKLERDRSAPRKAVVAYL
jgi:group I intron endonuclease